MAEYGLNFNDYIAILRRRAKVILIPTLLAPIIAFAISYAFTAKYTSKSLVLVEGQKVAQGYVQPVTTEDVAERISRLQEKVLSNERLKPMIERLNLARGQGGDDAVAQEVRGAVSVEAVDPSLVSVSGSGKDGGSHSLVHGKAQPPGFFVSYTASDPKRAQRMCTELTALVIEENLKDSEQVVQNTSDFLSTQIDQAKQSLDEQGSKLMAFKTRYLGQLPEDQEANLKMLGDLSTELDANTQALNRAQQDKAYAESLLAQKLTTWRATQGTGDPQNIRQQISQLEDHLLTLKARYTDDYPDVVKARNDIAALKKNLNDLQSPKAAASVAQPTDDLAEPSDIQQLRTQIHQYETVTAQATHEEKRLQDDIRTYQGRLELSPELQEEYSALSRDYEGAQKFYKDLLTKKSEAEMQKDVQRREEGQQMRLLDPPTLPDSPSFPVRWEFALGGLGAGATIGFGIVLWLEMRNRVIRTEAELESALDVPTLITIPWVGPETDLAIINSLERPRQPRSRSGGGQLEEGAKA